MVVTTAASCTREKPWATQRAMPREATSFHSKPSPVPSHTSSCPQTTSHAHLTVSGPTPTAALPIVHISCSHHAQLCNSLSNHITPRFLWQPTQPIFPYYTLSFSSYAEDLSKFKGRDLICFVFFLFPFELKVTRPYEMIYGYKNAMGI